MEIPNLQRILPLSAEAISQIHSSKHITSLPGVVLSLLENSLDANATKINISVDWKRGCCTVDDNGSGIPAAEFSDNGGLGKMHCTSKRAPVGPLADQVNELHGSNGLFVAELAAMSLLTITSTHASSQSASSIIIHQGKILSRRIHSHETLEFADSSGTSVVVKDLFGNMPVRVKQRALSEENINTDDKKWQQLKRGIVSYLQAWGNPCSVRLRDESIESRVVTIIGQHPNISAALTEKSLYRLAGKRSASRFDLRDALPMLFQSGLAPQESRNRWIPLSASSSSISLKGFICLDPAPSRQCQFIAIGIRPCNPITGQSELHDAVNKTFDSSSFGTIEGDLQVNNTDSSRETRGNVLISKQAAIRKGIDRWPMYSLQVKIAGRSSSFSDELENISEASLKAITDVLTAAVHAWLEKNHFRPRKRRKRCNEQQEAPIAASASSSRSASPQSGSLSATPASRRSLKKWGIERSIGEDSNQQSTSKRRTVTDLTLKPDSSNGMSANPTRKALALDHNLLSNIRTGRDRPKSSADRRLGSSFVPDTSAMAPQAAHVSSSEQNSFPAARTSYSASNTKTKALEAGATDSRSRILPIDSLAKEVGNTAPAEQNSQDSSSDYFGSVDGNEMIALEHDSRNMRQPSGGEMKSQDDPCEDGSFTWTDPAGHEIFRVHSRTGVVLPLSAGQVPSTVEGQGLAGGRQGAGIDTALSSAGKPLSLARRKTLALKDGSGPVVTDQEKWLPKFIRDWDNPVFARQQEEPIPAASLHGPGLLEIDDSGRSYAHDSHACHSLNRDALQSAGTKLSKEALRKAKVIGQVDRKFILCKLPRDSKAGESNSTLVLVDQHAASERIILEDLFQKLCTATSTSSSTGPQIQTTSLEHETLQGKPLHFEISSQENDLFQKFLPHFSTWGVTYTALTHNTDINSASHILKVTHLPTPIATRCATLPSLAIDLLRSELWALAEGSKKPLTTLTTLPTPTTNNDPSSASSPVWLSLLPLMPTKFLEMLHSRACRSAVMFNDVLTKEECTEVMRKVSECVFPFVCAHGRVGMVPVMEIGGDEKGGSGFGQLIGAGGDYGDDVNKREGSCDVGMLAKWMKANDNAQ